MHPASTYFTQVFYGESCYEGRLTYLFAQEFPTVWDTIRTINKEDYERLSHHMLRFDDGVTPMIKITAFD